MKLVDFQLEFIHANLFHSNTICLQASQKFLTTRKLTKHWRRCAHAVAFSLVCNKRKTLLSENHTNHICPIGLLWPPFVP